MKGQGNEKFLAITPLRKSASAHFLNCNFKGKTKAAQGRTLCRFCFMVNSDDVNYPLFLKHLNLVVSYNEVGKLSFKPGGFYDVVIDPMIVAATWFPK